MTKLILDPCLFEIPDNWDKDAQLDHFITLKDTIDFASECVDTYMDSYDGAPFCVNSENPPYAPPITKSLVIRNRFSEISKQIQKMVYRGEWIELQDNCVDACSLQFENNSTAELQFKQYLFYLIDNNDYKDTLLLLSKKNQCCSPKTAVQIENNVYVFSSVFDPSVDCHGIIAKYLKNSTREDAIFPQDTACRRLNDSFKHEIASSSFSNEERKTIFIKFGTEVASRNKYCVRQDLSRKNPRYEVFVHARGGYYLSIDVEHGGLEIFKKQGQRAKHLGEYNFSCILSKGPEPETHKLTI